MAAEGDTGIQTVNVSTPNTAVIYGQSECMVAVSMPREGWINVTDICLATTIYECSINVCMIIAHQNI